MGSTFTIGCDNNMKKFEDLELSSYLDIGANLGQFHQEMQIIYPGCPCVMIEPNPHSAAKLRKILNREPNENFRLIECGVSDHDGILTLITLHSKTKTKGASFYHPIDFCNPDDILKIDVPVRSLDSLFPEESFDLVKIDVQGSERDVLAGAQKFLPRARFVLVEVSLIEWNKGSAPANVLVKMLEELGFFIYRATDFHDYIKPTAQIDILFSNRISEHNLDSLLEYREVLGI
jgi:FkbM family methyltransferase